MLVAAHARRPVRRGHCPDHRLQREPRAAGLVRLFARRPGRRPGPAQGRSPPSKPDRQTRGGGAGTAPKRSPRRAAPHRARDQNALRNPGGTTCPTRRCIGCWPGTSGDKSRRAPSIPKTTLRPGPLLKKLQATVDAVAAGHPNQPLRLMFEDEARFGRMSDPVRCWAPAGCRPEVPTQRVREYTHVFGSVCPRDGELISLILPHADTPAMSLYLAEVSGRHPHEHILMFMDRAGWHQSQALVVPANITVAWLPPYSPQCNPQELVWREVRRDPFGNHDFDSMTAVETALERRLRQLESAPAQIQSLTGFDWIVSVKLKAK